MAAPGKWQPSSASGRAFLLTSVLIHGRQVERVASGRRVSAPGRVWGLARPGLIASSWFCLCGFDSNMALDAEPACADSHAQLSARELGTAASSHFLVVGER